MHLELLACLLFEHFTLEGSEHWNERRTCCRRLQSKNLRLRLKSVSATIFRVADAAANCFWTPLQAVQFKTISSTQVMRIIRECMLDYRKIWRESGVTTFKTSKDYPHHGNRSNSRGDWEQHEGHELQQLNHWILRTGIYPILSRLESWEKTHVDSFRTVENNIKKIPVQHVKDKRNSDKIIGRIPHQILLHSFKVTAQSRVTAYPRNCQHFRPCSGQTKRGTRTVRIVPSSSSHLCRLGWHHAREQNTQPSAHTCATVGAGWGICHQALVAQLNLGAQSVQFNQKQHCDVSIERWIALLLNLLPKSRILAMMSKSNSSFPFFVCQTDLAKNRREEKPDGGGWRGWAWYPLGCQWFH